MRIQLRRLTSTAQKVLRTASVVIVGTGVLASHAQAASNSRYAGFVIDANNGKVLYQENADAQRYPASLTKMMTLYLTFEALKAGRISLQDQMPVSAYAAGRPPSKLGLRPGSTLGVEEAISALVTKSANDAAVVLSEFLGGSESTFAERMTTKAHQLGMANTIFRNANGLPNPQQHTTARDMATLGVALREHFPEYYGYFSTRSYDFRGQRLGNHNRVLFRLKGADGIKTGYINASGFNLVTSVKRDGKSLVGVVMGGSSGRARDDQMVELINRYWSSASTRDTGPLVADASPLPPSGSLLPKRGPMPDRRPMTEDGIDARIALAYGSDAASAISRLPQPSNRPIVGKSALRAALVEERPVAQLALPAATQLAKRASASVSTPAAYDPNPTGSLAATGSTNSAWVVQIAAASASDDAMRMLNAAKSAVGGPLNAATPYTQAVQSGSQTLYRARFAGFDTKDAAWAACAALKRSSYKCYAVAN